MDLPEPSQEATLPLQTLVWGTIYQERRSPADTLYAHTGLRLYVIGDIDGGFRPRSNPYDLHTFGKPHPKDPLAEKLQGVWAQPVKGLSRYAYTLEVDGQRWALERADRFTQAFAFVQFDYRRGALHVARRDFAAQELPVLFSTLTIRNESDEPVDVHVTFLAEFDLEDAWFTRLSSRRNAGETVTVEGRRLVARAEVLPDQWAAVAGGEAPAADVRVREGSVGELTYRLHIDAGAERSLTSGMAVVSEGGAPAALAMLDRALPDHARLLAEKIAVYDALQIRGPHLSSPDPAFNAAFDLARANLQMLEALSPALGRYFYAGLEIFPFWFSNDGAYSLPGLLAAGFRQAALSHVRIGFHTLEEGRVPHQISPSGRVAFKGNAQETPLWVLSAWEAYRWTGDRAFLAEMYPGAIRGMFDYALGAIDPDGDGYPSGPGMVEVEGMGAEKLDSAAYTWAALRAVRSMAETLGDLDRARQAGEWAERIESRFDSDWWDAPNGTYAMSLQDPGNARYAAPHWAVVVPLEVGLSTAEHAAETFATLRARYLNAWGLKHTIGDDERVWTLPTATLSRAAYRYGETELGFDMLSRIAATLQAGSIGLFHELIPEGACIIQLWSAATFLRGVVEDLFGIEVDAAGRALRLAPHLPAGWPVAALENLAFGEHRVSVTVSNGRVNVAHLEGPAPLVVEWAPGGEKIVRTLVEPGTGAQLE